MSYASAEMLKSRLGSDFARIYRDDYSIAAEDLSQASSEIDAYLGSRYRVPIKSGSAASLLQDWNLTLAEEKAYVRSAFSTLPEKTVKRVEVVRRQLRDAASGLIKIPGAIELGADGGGSGAGAAVLEIDDPVFGRKKMKGY